MSSAMAFLGLLTPVLGLSPKFYGNGTCCVNSTQYVRTRHLPLESDHRIISSSSPSHNTPTKN